MMDAYMAKTTVETKVLLAAAAAPKPDKLRKLLGPNVAINARYDGWSLLDVAASAGRCATVEFLLQRGADYAAADEGGTTALHLALSARANIANSELSARQNTAMCLLEAGADAHAIDAHGRTVFWHACNLARGKATELVAFLLEKKPDLLATDHDGFSILHMAVRWNHLEVLQRALAAGADVNAVFDGSKRTALGLAVDGEHHAALSLLLDSGALPNVAGPPEEAPLTRAAWNDDHAAVKLLMAHGADPRWLLAEFDSGRRTAIKGKTLFALREALAR